jgi:hypothetical protein
MVGQHRNRYSEDQYPKRRGRPIGTTKALPLWDDPRASPDTMKKRRQRERQRAADAALAAQREMDGPDSQQADPADRSGGAGRGPEDNSNTPHHLCPK